MKVNFFWMIALMGLGILFTSCEDEDTFITQEADFEDLVLEEESYWNGSDGSGSFTSANKIFHNDYNADWFSWSGFAYSNITDNTTQGYSNQYSAIPGFGYDRSETYAVAYSSPKSIVAIADSTTGEEIRGVFITNATYPYMAMKYGDDFSKKFGGADGTDPDWFLLTIRGIGLDDETTGEVEFFLADYRFEDDADDYIVNDWEWVDLTSLGTVKRLEFSLSSSDVGDWGMNTPAYFCLDNLRGRIYD